VTSIVSDTSALIAILNDEADSDQFKHALRDADRIVISTATLFEATCVVRNPQIVDGPPRLDALIDELQPEIAAFDTAQLITARMAYARYGRGSRHAASLNLGDCFSYALARTRNLPLLFKGADFSHTDIVPALGPAFGPAEPGPAP
jgi:ribonuclease VapC